MLYSFDSFIYLFLTKIIINVEQPHHDKQNALYFVYSTVAALSHHLLKRHCTSMLIHLIT